MNKCSVACLVLLSVSGCAVSPKVAYETNIKNDTEGKIKFRLAKTVVIVDKDKTDEKKRNIVMTAVPVEGGDSVYAIRSVDSQGVKTHLKVTKRDNTELIQSIGTEIEDRRIQTIEQLGGLAGLIVTVKKRRPIDELPLAIDISAKHLNTPIAGEVEKKGEKLGRNWKYDISIDKKPDDAIKRDDYISSIQGKTVDVFFYSACRKAILTFVDGDYKGETLSFTVSDPHYVQTIKFPRKGKIEMHSSCGVNVSSEKAEIASTTQIINTLITQAKSLIEKNKKAKAPTTTKK